MGGGEDHAAYISKVNNTYPAHNDYTGPNWKPWIRPAEISEDTLEDARVSVHINQQLNGGLCKYGEDHRLDGPCHNIVEIVIAAINKG